MLGTLSIFGKHFAFGRDQEYLRSTAYPVLKEVCHFWEDQLKERPDGKLVAPMGWSPETTACAARRWSPLTTKKIIYDLFTNTIEAADVLGDDPEFRDRLAGLREKTTQAANWSLGSIARMGRGQRRSKRRSPPRIPFVCVVSRAANFTISNAPASRSGTSFFKRSGRRKHGLEPSVEDQLLGPALGWRSFLPTFT